MQDRPDTATSPSDRVSLYSERLRVPIWWWPIALGIIGLLAAEIHMGAPGLRAWVPYVVLAPVPIAVLLWLGRFRVEATREPNGQKELRAGAAHLPVPVIARAATIPASAKSAALGRQLDPAAFVQHRPWVGPMVLVVLDDPDDPTPYWLISTRRPKRLLEALDLADASRSES